MTQPGFVQDEGAFTFNDDVASTFGEMLDQSVPQLALMRETVARFGAPYVWPGANVVDLGASLGDAVAALRAASPLEAQRYTLVERSAPMLAGLRERFGDDPLVTIDETDLRYAYPAGRTSLTLCVLTLQFIPIERRIPLLSRIRQSTVPGGALILVEKVISFHAAMDAALVAAHNGAKIDAGYGVEEIDRNLLALEGVLVPLPADVNADLVRGAGFGQVECIWRWGNFAAWLALADG